jgi:hypothetical protein
MLETHGSTPWRTHPPEKQMSIELLPPDKKHPNEYHVRPNYCRCHPETCCCDPWAVFDGNGEKWETFWDKTIAERVAKSLNAGA